MLKIIKSISVEIRPIAADEVGLVESHIHFDWASIAKHRERFCSQQEGQVVYLVAWSRNMPVGHVLLCWGRSPDEPMQSLLADCPDLQDAFVVPQYRSKGIGSRLLDAAELLVKQPGYARMGLGVAVDNPRARALYERLGYEDARFGSYATGGRYFDRDGHEQTWEEICNYLIKKI